MRLIDADALIETLHKDPLYDLVGRYGIDGVIESMPTHTPTNTPTNTPTDLISRQAAIDAVEKAVFKDVAKSAIESLPPVEPKRPKGEWIVYPLIDDGRVELECPECGETFIQAIDYRPHFCENCGADMRGDKE